MIKVGLIGCGNWGKNYIRNLNQITGFQLAAVCDPNEFVKTLLTDNTRHTHEYQTILADPEIRAVVIATPPSYHYLMAKQALLKGKDVLVEKPLTLAKQEAVDLFRLAKERKRILMTGHIMEFHPIVKQLKSYITNNLLGSIYYINMARTNLGLVRSDVNVLWDLGVHDLSIIRFLLEERPVSVSAQGGVFLQEKVEDLVFLTLRYRSGLMVKIHASWLDPNKTRLITIVGDTQMVTFDDMNSSEKIRIYNRGVGYKEYSHDIEYPFIYRYGDITIPTIKMYEPLREQCQHFLECIKNRKEPLTGAEDSLWVAEVLEKAQKSLEAEGKVISLEWGELDELLNKQ